MTTTKHTSGPWTVDTSDGYRVLSPTGGYGYTVATVNSHNYTEPTAEANARLIAAAPDLYAACKLMVIHRGGSHTISLPGDGFAILDAAIKRAERGEA